MHRCVLQQYVSYHVCAETVLFHFFHDEEGSVKPRVHNNIVCQIRFRIFL